MADLFIQSKQLQRKREAVSKYNERKIASIYEMGIGLNKEIKPDSIYQKAIDEYEDYKRISKHNLQESREDVSSIDTQGNLLNYIINLWIGRNDLQMKSNDSKPFNNAGKSVLTYK